MAYNTLAPFYAVPVAAGTVNIPAFDGPLQTAILNPAGTLATLSVVLPAAADGQTVKICSTQTVTLLTLTSAAGSILGAVTTLAVNGSASYTWSASASQWVKS